MPCPYCINNDGICQQRCIAARKTPIRKSDKQVLITIKSQRERELYELKILEQRTS